MGPTFGKQVQKSDKVKKKLARDMKTPLLEFSGSSTNVHSVCKSSLNVKTWRMRSITQ